MLPIHCPPLYYCCSIDAHKHFIIKCSVFIVEIMLALQASPFCLCQTLHLCSCKIKQIGIATTNTIILTSTSLWVEPPPARWTYAPWWSALYLFLRLAGVSRSMGIAPRPSWSSRWNSRRCACTSLNEPLC